MQADCCDFQLNEAPAGANDHDVIEDGEETQLLLSEPASDEPDFLRFRRFGVDATCLNAPEAGTSRGRVLVVDDDGAFALTCARMLNASGYAVRVANDGWSATRMAAEEHFDAIVSDINLPDSNGIQVLQDVRKADKDMPVILVTGQPDLDTARAAVELGAISYLLKPVSAAQLERELHRALHRRRTTSRMQIVADQEKRQEDLSERFSRALRGLWMAFQPIVSWSRKSIVGYEALVRTNEPSLSSPLDFLKAAEDLKQIGLFGQSVRRHVASVMTGCPHRSTMFVNLHSLELLDKSLYDPASPLAAFAEQVCFEITERTAVDDTSDFLARTRRLRSLGYKIVVSDVAGGSSGLGNLALLEPDAVKIEMSLFREIESVEVKRKMMRAVTTLCQELDVPLIAEGIESEAERDDFAAKGGDLMQGYLFARPDFPLPEPRF
jgi:EAL domain-containing protein (putative c-di-GMP-specific phosphodiesterase class I)